MAAPAAPACGPCRRTAASGAGRPLRAVGLLVVAASLPLRALQQLWLAGRWHPQSARCARGSRSLLPRAAKKKVDPAVLERRRIAAKKREEAIRRAEAKRREVAAAKAEAAAAEAAAEAPVAKAAAPSSERRPVRRPAAKAASAKARAPGQPEGRAAAASRVDSVAAPARGAPAPTAAEAKLMTVVELKEALRSAGLKVSGNKAELVARLAGQAAPEPAPGPTAVDAKAMKVAELKDALRSAGLTVSGRKAELLDRLLTHLGASR